MNSTSKLEKFLEASLAPGRRRTKIIATVGPASRSPEKISALIEAGVNVFRLNFSHGSHAEHLEVFKTIRSVSKTMNSHVAVLQDLSGPKIRISNVDADYVEIPDGSKVILKAATLIDGKSALSNPDIIYVEGLNPSLVLKSEQSVLLADGLIVLSTDSVSSDSVSCHAIKGGRLRSRVGIAFPDSNIDLPATTEKDMRDLAWGIENEVDYVALSFVQNARDLETVRTAINNKNSSVRIISKIERKIALENIKEIFDASDGVMVARGDLGLEFPLEQVPMVQKRLIEEANFRGLPVIVATQMLHSMITAVRPTRAEVSDIAAAVMGGADALMLSEETAIGENPVESVSYLSRIAAEAEKSFEFEEYKLRLRKADQQTVPDAISYAACAAALKVNASAIIACTETGNSARLIAKYRPQQPLYGTSTQEVALRRMSLYWGVMPVPCPIAANHYEEIDRSLHAVQVGAKFPNGSTAVVTGGIAVSQPGSTNTMEVRQMSYLE